VQSDAQNAVCSIIVTPPPPPPASSGVQFRDWYQDFVGWGPTCRDGSHRYIICFSYGAAQAGDPYRLEWCQPYVWSDLWGVDWFPLGPQHTSYEWDGLPPNGPWTGGWYDLGDPRTVRFFVRCKAQDQFGGNTGDSAIVSCPWWAIPQFRVAGDGRPYIRYDCVDGLLP
jgi:hypothetical protein